MIDIINSLFQIGVIIFSANNCLAVFMHRSSAGVSPVSAIFFNVFGLWNSFFFASLDQTMSFLVSISMLMINAVYLYLVFRYRPICRKVSERDARVFPFGH